ncbi:hypothetical protein [Cognatishimia maritima]|uniref:Uncharacterized protein n=1 Tax=Cognatishimia maritima TaxID=870908 RepID=A0A1M5UWV9_9RHOB|nr:hypothetical protein [Cognatishimia maritima]SHH67491.1 hypothetical protein SAMN04488044_2987 [Cognatishimia maritima]
MKKTLSVAAVSLMFAAPAFAGGHCDGDACVVNKAGKTVWTIDSLENLEGTNPGGKGRTQNAAGGLTKAVGAGGLNLVVPSED